MPKREGVDLVGKRLIIYRPAEGEDLTATRELAMAIANGTGLYVVVLPDGQTLESLSDEDIEHLGFIRKAPEVS